METHYLMWLSRVRTVGFDKYCKLLTHFSSAEAVWKASKAALQQVKGIPEKTINEIIESRNEAKLKKWIAEMEQYDIEFISYFDELYPKLLREIHSPPMGIYVRGTLPDDDIDKVSIVGSRKCTQYGVSVALDIAETLGRSNIVVVSGMAKGIDGMSHQGAINGRGKTIAVLGCGVDVCYPKENEILMEEIIRNGCVISEYPPKTQPSRGHFPSRNRIIAGLSKILVVVEAGKKSGTLITVDLALDCGRDVFAVPGNTTSSLSEGTNNLIKQGCVPLTEGNDILFELKIAYNDDEKSRFVETKTIKLKELEREVYDLIPDLEPVTTQSITQKLKLPIQEIQYTISMLEIMGLIQKMPQSGYVRIL
ncbi:MAG: DNA-processing protein DprA [Bacillota bacterium]